MDDGLGNDGLGNDEVGNDELERQMHGRRRVGMILEECLNVMSDLLKDNGDGNGLERDEYRELEVYGREDEGMAEEEGFGAYGLRDELARALEKKGFEKIGRAHV